MKTAVKNIPRLFDGKAMGALSGTVDRYKGITINSELLSTYKCQEEWSKTLSNSLIEYKKEGLRAVWMRIPK